MARAVKKRKPKKTDKKQSARFIEAARELGLDEKDHEEFERVLRRMVAARKKKRD